MSSRREEIRGRRSRKRAEIDVRTVPSRVEEVLRKVSRDSKREKWTKIEEVHLKRLMVV